MALRKAPYWTDLYYSIVEHYFWRPQAIGRKAHPDAPRYSWDHWKGKLRRQETPLNHILDLLFHISPQDLLDQSISALLGRPVSNLQLVEPVFGTIDLNVVQPDIIVSNSNSLVFVEMKVDSKSSIDQFAKYAIAAHSILKDERQIENVDLVVLSRHKDHAQVWRSANKKGLSSASKVRKLAIRGISGDSDVWDEKGVLRYMNNNPGCVASLSKQINSMGLVLADYEMLATALNKYASHEETLSRLIEGVLKEFDRRKLNSSGCNANENS